MIRFTGGRTARARALTPLLLVCSAAPLGATGNAPPPLRLAAVVEEARERNPELRAARERARAAASVPERVRAYDDPVVSWEAWNFPDSFAIDRADNNIVRLSQKVPFPGKRTLAGTAAERDADVVRRQADAVELDVVTGVKRAFADLWQAHATLEVYEREKMLVERFAHVAEQRYALGQVSQADVLRAQVELTHVINRTATQALAIDAAGAELSALLSRDPDEPLGVPEDVPPPRFDREADDLMRLAAETRPELRAQEAAVAREEAAVRLAERGYLPDFEFNFARFVNAGQRDGFGAMAAVSIPIAYKGKYDAALDEARARLGSAQADLRRVRDRVQRDVKQADLRVRTALLQWHLFANTHIPQAEQSLRVAESAYQTGSLDWLALIDTARTLESAHVEHIQAEAEFDKGWADLERAVGTELPRGAEEPHGSGHR
jgi:outer membrane protein TolC